MQYRDIKTLKAQVEHILATKPEARNSDAELVVFVCETFGHDPIKKATSIERCRRFFNQHNRFLPTLESVARQRKMNIDEWRVALGYPTQNGDYEPPSEQERKKVHQYPSKTKRGVYYSVVETEGGIICDCPSFQYRGKCKHLTLTEKEIQQQVMKPLF